MTILAAVWAELDSITESMIKVGKIDPEWKQETRDAYMVKRGQAQGLAFAIMHYAKPHFADVQAVSKHAVRRYKHKIGQLDEIEPTPGLDGFIPPPGSTATRAAKKGPVQQFQEPTPAAFGDLSGVSEEQLQLATNGIGANIPDKTLLKLAKVTQAQLDAIKASLAKA